MKMMKTESKLTLEVKQWGDFLLTEFFTFKKGNQSNMASLSPGTIPLVSAKKIDNGYKDFVSSNGKQLYQANILTLNNDGDGGAGLSYYQPYTMALDSHVTALIPRRYMSRHLLIFISRCITNQHERFGNGYPLNERRINKFKFMLPVCDNDTSIPDWDFMEAYMKQTEEEILKPTIEKLCKQLIISNIGGGKSLHSNWKAFLFTDVFTEIQRGKRLRKADHNEGRQPYVSSTSQNNGIDGFISNKSGVRVFEDCITIANSGSVGCAFYHSYQFVASDHVTQLKRKELDRYAYLFIATMVSRLTEKYSFNREINDERIKREHLLLPATEKGEIDFEFMTKFMQEVESDILGTTLKYLRERQSVNKCKMGGGKLENL